MISFLTIPASGMRQNRGLWIVSMICLACMVTWQLMSNPVSASTPADTIIHNAVIFTSDVTRPIANAVAIKDGKFLYVGSNRLTMRLRGPNTVVVDAMNRFITPGFIDAHTHIV